MYSPKRSDKHPRFKERILILHALSGFDSTSALFKKGKQPIIKILETFQFVLISLTTFLYSLFEEFLKSQVLSTDLCLN